MNTEQAIGQLADFTSQEVRCRGCLHFIHPEEPIVKYNRAYTHDRCMNFHVIMCSTSNCNNARKVSDEVADWMCDDCIEFNLDVKKDEDNDKPY